MNDTKYNCGQYFQNLITFQFIIKILYTFTGSTKYNKTSCYIEIKKYHIKVHFPTKITSGTTKNKKKPEIHFTPNCNFIPLRINLYMYSRE